MLKTGLLWMDHDPRLTLEQHVAIAVARYYRKFGEMPDTCAVHKSVQGDVKKIGMVRVVGKSNVLVGHYWVGQDEK